MTADRPGAVGRRTCDFGAWPSPITPEHLAAAAIAYSLLRADGLDIYWSERRPAEAARVAVVRRDGAGSVGDVIDPPFSARSRVHEYGGGHFAVRDGRVAFVNDADQDLYMAGEGGPRRLTELADTRFADMDFDPARPRLVAIAERQGRDKLPQNMLVAVPCGGGSPDCLLAGRDFYASPRFSPDGRRLAWLAWDLPSMPWQAAELWVGEFGPDGGIMQASKVAVGGAFQPEWASDGALYFVADRDGWGNLHVLRDGKVRLVAPTDADLSRPLWSLGTTSYAVLGPGRVIASAWRDGICEVAIAGEEEGWKPLTSDFARVDDIAAGPGIVAISGASDTAPSAINLLPRPLSVIGAGGRPVGIDLSGGDISRPRLIAFERDGERVRALFYPPASTRARPPEIICPPLVVSAHGGPTSMARRGFSLERLFWTTRGFAYLDVDYRGSTGYGARYRDALDGAWGLADADDTIAAAGLSAATGLCDPERMVVRGGSAGGLTVLNALARSDIFAAGASYYGVADLAGLAADTHKFESGYLDSLVGGAPGEVPDIYAARSPVNHADAITAPVIFFQGLEDRVVPPSQTRAMVACLKARGVPVASVEFPGEGHGFRKAATLVAALKAELAFYALVLGLEPADDLPHLDIANLETTR